MEVAEAAMVLGLAAAAPAAPAAALELVVARLAVVRLAVVRLALMRMAGVPCSSHTESGRVARA